MNKWTPSAADLQVQRCWLFSAPRFMRLRPSRLRRPHAEPSAAGSPGFLDLVFMEAALAADLITASKSLYVPMTAIPFLDPAV